MVRWDESVVAVLVSAFQEIRMEPVVQVASLLQVASLWVALLMVVPDASRALIQFALPLLLPQPQWVFVQSLAELLVLPLP